MGQKRHTYTVISAALWSLVGGLTGATAGAYMSMDARGIVFAVIVGVGAAWLILLNGGRSQRREVPEKPATPLLLAAGSLVQPAAKGLAATPQSFALSQLLAGDEDRILTPAEAREWLDEFLVEHQRQ